MVGQTLSHYEVLEKLGAGGMGVVYKAKDLYLERLVALKFLAAHLMESDTAHARFMREARSISALNHPNIATIYEVGESGGETFLAFEFIAGGTLKSRLAELQASGRKMPIDDVVAIATQLAEGLAHAHRNSILHRDIKPGNLMFSAEGKLKIMDFGLSKLLSAPDITKTGVTLGTALYMSPEQAGGKPTDQRSDIFSFGIVLYEMIAGESPFGGQNELGALRAITESKPVPIEQLRPDVPGPLRTVVERALEKDLRDRYQSMDEVLDDLRSERSNREGAPTATLTGLESRPSRPRIRLSRKRWILAAMLAILAISALFFGRWLTREKLPEQKQIAVLAFENIGDSGNQAFCDGLVETLTSVLTQMGGVQGLSGGFQAPAGGSPHQLLVIPSSEIRRQAVASPSDARRVFKANLVITGSVQRTGDQVRVIANLVDTSSPPHNLNSRLITRRVNDLAELQDELVNRIAELLEVELRPPAKDLLAAGRTSVGSAYDAYLQATGYLERWDKPGNLDQALALMQKATALDPHFALAYAGLAWAKWRKFTFTPDPKLLEEARDLALHAVSIDPRVALAHVMLGLVYEKTGRIPDAIRSYRTALDFDPVSVEAYRGLAQSYEAQGNLEEAQKVYQRAIQLRPGDWFSQTQLGMFYSNHGNYPSSEAAFRKAVDLTPDNFVAYRNLASMHYLMGRYDEAVKEYRRSIALKPSSGAYVGLAGVYFMRGQYREAAATTEQALRLSTGNSYTLLGNLGDCYRYVPELASKAPEMYRKAIAMTDQFIATNAKDTRALGHRAMFYAKLGNIPQALRDLETAQATDTKDVNAIYTWAVVLDLAHHRDEALARLKEAVEVGYSIESVRHDPDLANLRRDPRFARIIAPFLSTQAK